MNRATISQRLLPWGFIAVFALVLATFVVPRIGNFVDALLLRAAASLGGQTNVYIALAFLALSPVAFLVLFRLKPVTLITLVIALLPILSPLRRFFGIYAYTDWMGGTQLISGLAIIAPLLFIYLCIFHPVSPQVRGWRLPQSKWFYLMPISALITQPFFFSLPQALRIVYVLTMTHLFWYLIVVAYVNTIEDSRKLLWAILATTVLSILLTAFTAGDQGAAILEQQKYARVKSAHMGSSNEYGVLMTSTLCLLPILLYRTTNLGKCLLMVAPVILGKTLIATGTRGAYVSILPIFGYLYLYRVSPKRLAFFLMASFLVLLLLYDPLTFYLQRRPITLTAYEDRFSNSMAILEALLSWPYFFLGYGFGTIQTFWNIPGAYYGHAAHNGYLQAWIELGFLGFVGFLMWIFITLKTGVWKALRTPVFEEKLTLLGLVLSVCCWLILFISTTGNYTGGIVALYTVLTTELALITALTKKATLYGHLTPSPSYQHCDVCIQRPRLPRGNDRQHTGPDVQ